MSRPGCSGHDFYPELDKQCRAQARNRVLTESCPSVNFRLRQRQHRSSRIVHRGSASAASTMRMVAISRASGELVRIRGETSIFQPNPTTYPHEGFAIGTTKNGAGALSKHRRRGLRSKRRRNESSLRAGQTLVLGPSESAPWNHLVSS